MGTVVESDDCTKRFIYVFDATKQESFYIGICNEWFRLKYRELIIKEGGTSRGNSWSSYEDRLKRESILQDIILSNSGYDFEHTRRHFEMGRGFKEYVNFPMCDRPYLDASVRVDKAIEYLSKMGEALSHGRLSLGHYDTFYSHITSVLTHNINRALGYAKYKKYQKVAGQLNNRLLKGFGHTIDDEFIAELTDFMIAMINQK